MPGSKNWKMETEKSNKTSSFTECDIRKIKVNLWQWTCNLHLYEYKKNYGTWMMRTGISRDKKCFQVFQQRKCFFYKFSLLPHIVNIKKPQTDKVMLFLWKSSPLYLLLTQEFSWQKLTSGRLVHRRTQVKPCETWNSFLSLLSSTKLFHCSATSSTVGPNSTNTFLHFICILQTLN